MSADTRLDSRAHVTAIRAALDAVLGAGVVYEWGQVPGEGDNAGSLPAIWALLSVERRFNLARRVSAETGMTLWRVTVGVVGTTPGEARWAIYKVATALNEESLTIGGDISSPLQLESDQSPTREEGRYYAAATYTYAL